MREGVSRRTAFRKLGKRKLRQRTRRERLEAEATEFSSLIKPSDNWNFYNVFYDRIEDGDGHGYIPGDLYANALFYYTKPGDLSWHRWQARARSNGCLRTALCGCARRRGT